MKAKNGECSADYKTAMERADELLIRADAITKFPIDCSLLVKELGKEAAIALFPFSWIEEHGYKLDDFVRSNDADTKEWGGRFYIFYNEKKLANRKLFTIGHEIGHIFLGHDMEVVRKYIETKDERLKARYDKYELEAQCFSARLCMPPAVINTLRVRGCKINEEFLKKHFGTSGPAARICLKNLCRRSQKGLFDDVIVLKFDKFIKSLAPRQKSFVEEWEDEEKMQRKREEWLENGY